MVWQYMTTLIKIIDILLESDFDSSILIKEHNEGYVQLFKKPLKPKYHFLTHYPEIVRRTGPPNTFGILDSRRNIEKLRFIPEM